MERNNWHANLVQNLPLGLFRITFGPIERLLKANEAAAGIFGFESVEELIRAPLRTLFLDLKQRRKFLRKLISQGELIREQLKLKKKDGSQFWGAVSARVIRDIPGEVKYIDGIIEDITSQKQIEEALRISEERFRNIADEVDDWVWEIGSNLVIRYSNTRVNDILGYTPKEVVGRNLVDFLAPEEQNRIEGQKDYLLKEVIFASQQTCMVRKDGRIIITESSGVPIFRRDRSFVGFQGLTRDISEQVKTKEEQELRRQQLIQADKMISLGILVSGVAHEINNPNQFIMVNAPMLKRAWENITPIIDRYYEENGDFVVSGLSYGEMRGRFLELFSGICDGAQRIKLIVKNLKDYAREGNSGILQEININDIIKSSLLMVSNMLKNSTNNLRIELAQNLPLVKGNFQRLEQVLINLLQNACQALPNPANGVTITTSFDEKKNCVLVKIKDEGVGIEANQMEYIFDPFFTTKRDYGGTGLGLSISTGIIEEHGGKMQFSSKPGKGTTVSIILPALAPPQCPAPPADIDPNE